jgi:HAD superfamily hydrolase (TIGR01509 family)
MKLMRKAVIFDMDGVISDTQKLHADVEREVLLKYGAYVSDASVYAGISDYDMFSDLIKKHNISHIAPSRLVEEKWVTLREQSARIKPIPGVVDLIKYLCERKVTLAIASGSPKEFIEKVVNELNLNSYFSALVSSEEVPLGKPAPDVFLKVSSLIGVTPEDTIVIEDGNAGVEGAKSAGMKAVFLGRTNTIADLTIPSFMKLDYKKLLGLFDS